MGLFGGQIILLSTRSFFQSMLSTYYTTDFVSPSDPPYQDFALTVASSDDVVAAAVYSINRDLVAFTVSNDSMPANTSIPDSLFPIQYDPNLNLTYIESRNSYLVGPASSNSTFFVSYTRYLTENNPDFTGNGYANISNDVIGYLTVISLATPVVSVINDLNGLDGTGSLGLIELQGQDDSSNSTTPTLASTSSFSSSYPSPSSSFTPSSYDNVYGEVDTTGLNYTFVFPATRCHQCFNRSYTLDKFAPGVLVLVEGFSGALIDYDSEDFGDISVGYAPVSMSSRTWGVIIFQTHKTVYGPIYNLRNILLASVFAIGFGMCIITLFLSGWIVRPITRLQAATEQTTSLSDFKRKPKGWERVRRWQQNLSKAVKFWKWNLWHWKPSKQSNSQHDNKDSKLGSDSGSSSLGEQQTALQDLQALEKKPSITVAEFRIPEKLKIRRIIRDELTELTETFNSMTDELRKQYSVLEERVVQRTQEIKAAKSAADSANEAKSLFIANITHELRTPLNGILGMTQVSMSEKDPSKVKDSLKVIFKSGELLLHFLTDLLTFSKTQAGRVKPDEKAFKISEITAQLKAIFGQQSAQAGIDLSIEVVSCFLDDVVLYGDLNRILQVVMNFVSNGLKFTPYGGKVNISISAIRNRSLSSYKSPTTGPSESDDSRLSISSAPTYFDVDYGTNQSRKDSELDLIEEPTVKSRRQSWRRKVSPSFKTSSNPSVTPDCERDNTTPHLKRSSIPENSDKVTFDSHSSSRSSSPSNSGAKTTNDSITICFQVSDTGPGIASHLQARIFEPFVQGDLALDKRRNGAGLGLSICRQLASSMHGTVDLESELGQGSTFTFKIPLQILKDGVKYLSPDLMKEDWPEELIIAPENVDNSALPDSTLDSDNAYFTDTGTETGTVNTPNSDEKKLSNGEGEDFFGPRPKSETSASPRPPMFSSPVNSFGEDNRPKPARSYSANAVPSPEGPVKRPMLMRHLTKDDRKLISSVSVLLAEDNRVNQEVMVRMLQIEGIKDVTIANDGLEAVAQVREYPLKFHIIFMDVQMPNLDGLKATGLIRSELGYEGPIVSVSAYADKTNIDNCLAAGMNHFLAKPLRRPHLHKILVELLIDHYEVKPKLSSAPPTPPAVA